MKGVVVAGTGSGCGKTTVSLGLMAALAGRGLRVAPFKVGPDFIDPGHHRQAAGRPGRNLDGWMLPRATNERTFRRSVGAADVAVVEGVMGLFDGYDGRSESGSTAEMAKWLGLPVLLVVDARSMARSAAALVQGFENFDPGLGFAGVAFNRIGSERHLRYLREALADTVRMPCLGGFGRDEAVSVPERHLGLVTAEDHPLDARRLARLAAMVETGLDVDGLLSALPEVAADPETAALHPAPSSAPARIGVARDRAFCFYYEDNLERLERCGARLVPFSPLADRELPPDLDGLYFGGGYPELSAAALAGNASMRAGVRAASEAGMPIYAECGGFMYLCAELDDLSGARAPMAGCFPFAARMLPRLKALGYREVRLTRDTLLGPVGTVLRGHEFHYSEMEPRPGPVDSVYATTTRDDPAPAAPGFLARRTLASYVHLHFGSAPAAAGAFVDACRAYRLERESHDA
jgi:cobyrinic acid a,c-diamide synthase